MSMDNVPVVMEELRGKLLPIRLLAFDVDGVLTDGGLHLGDSDLEILRFDVKDGSAIAMAIRSDYLVALISGRKSRVVARRAEMLGIKDVLLGISDKKKTLLELMEKYALLPNQTLFMGDDVLDLSAFSAAGFSVAPADAAEDVIPQANYVCRKSGGRGAVREIIEMVMRVQGKWIPAVDRVVQRVPHVAQ